MKCVNCHNFAVFLFNKSFNKKYSFEFRENKNWVETTIKEIYKKSQSGVVLLLNAGNLNYFTVCWDKI